ncbi:hypothetical protein BaRGS_00009399, partial [Batillaria attramentaria]
MADIPRTRREFEQKDFMQQKRIKKLLVTRHFDCFCQHLTTSILPSFARVLCSDDLNELQKRARIDSDSSVIFDLLLRIQKSLKKDPTWWEVLEEQPSFHSGSGPPPTPQSRGGPPLNFPDRPPSSRFSDRPQLLSSDQPPPCPPESLYSSHQPPHDFPDRQTPQPFQYPSLPVSNPSAGDSPPARDTQRSLPDLSSSVGTYPSSTHTTCGSQVTMDDIVTGRVFEQMRSASETSGLGLGGTDRGLGATAGLSEQNGIDDITIEQNVNTGERAADPRVRLADGDTSPGGEADFSQSSHESQNIDNSEDAANARRDLQPVALHEDEVDETPNSQEHSTGDEERQRIVERAAIADGSLDRHLNQPNASWQNTSAESTESARENLHSRFSMPISSAAASASVLPQSDLEEDDRERSLQSESQLPDLRLTSLQPPIQQSQNENSNEPARQGDVLSRVSLGGSNNSAAEGERTNTSHVPIAVSSAPPSADDPTAAGSGSDNTAPRHAVGVSAESASTGSNDIIPSFHFQPLEVAPLTHYPHCGLPPSERQARTDRAAEEKGIFNPCQPPWLGTAPIVAGSTQVPQQAHEESRGSLQVAFRGNSGAVPEWRVQQGRRDVPPVVNVEGTVFPTGQSHEDDVDLRRVPRREVNVQGGEFLSGSDSLLRVELQEDGSLGQEGEQENGDGGGARLP